MPYVQSDGARLYFETSGTGTPIVFIHEFSGDLWSWEKQIQHFGRRYRCVAFNARGYPPSEVPTDATRQSATPTLVPAHETQPSAPPISVFKYMILGFVIVFGLGVVGLGGMAAMGFLGPLAVSVSDDGTDLSDPETTATDPETTTVENTPVETIPGKRIKLKGDGSPSGDLQLKQRPSGAATVTITGVDFDRLDWDGTGTLDLVGLKQGLYTLKTNQKENDPLIKKITVSEGKVACYRFGTDDGGKPDWNTCK